MCDGITCCATATEAMMNANSPICDNVNPDLTESSRLAPATNAEAEQTNALTTKVIITNARISFQYSNKICGSIIMPTETKKIAEKRFLILSVRCSIRWLSAVSDKMEPMTNAPSAEEKPTWLATITMAKHRPMEIISRFSSLIYFLNLRNSVGIR